MNRRSDAVNSVCAQKKRSGNRMVAYVRVHASEQERERGRERERTRAGTNEREY